MQQDNSQRPYKGLHTDSSYGDSPKETYTFALNTVSESEIGDFGFLSNEESNSPCSNFPLGYVPIGKEYMGEGKTIVFLAHETMGISEIGIYDDNCKYETIVNDFESTLKQRLNFKITHQIDATYRLRRGCERTVYWVDDLNKPKYFNFDKLKDFKNFDGTWSNVKFNLQKTYSKIPNFQNVEVLDAGGNIKAGSYNIAIQYVDTTLNTSEWITTSKTIKIYNDFESKTFKDINGSTHSATSFLNFSKTTKAIKLTFSNLDTNYLYYRLAFIEATSGSGLINNVITSELIPTNKTTYIYTGDNGAEYVTKEEILQFADIIEKAQSIEQIENRLIIANTQGKQIDFCNFQKFASKIKADCITKNISLTDIKDPANPKKSSHEFEAVGYMPGEIYSFGIVYIFEDGTLTPVYHIVGKSNDVAPETVFSLGNNTFPMALNNTSSTTIYNENDSCNNLDYWGTDSENQPLKDKFVRHHRFPLRSQINKALVNDFLENEQTNTYYQLNLNIVGDLIIPVPCPTTTPNCGTDNLPSFEIKVTYKVDGQFYSFTQVINPALYADNVTNSYLLDIIQTSQYHNSNLFTDISYSITDVNGNFQNEISVALGAISDTTTDNIYFNNNATYEFTNSVYTSNTQNRNFNTDILGIKFSNIQLPIQEEEEPKIIGYYIVRNERTEFDKTILDTGVLVPCVTNDKYISQGLLQPETDKISPNVFGLIHPEHKFEDKQYVSYDKIIQQGNFNVINKKFGKINYDDVYVGSSYQSKYQRKNNDDADDVDGSPTSKGYDGWSFNLITRDNIVSYETKNDFEINNTDIKDRFYLNALDYKTVNDNQNDVYNISCDNKIGIVELNSNVTLPKNNLPYVVFYKENLNSYSGFRNLPYYKEHVNPIYFNQGDSSVCTIFSGDTYVSSMKYLNTMFYDNRVSKRVGRRSFLKTFLGAFVVVLGAALVATGVLAPEGAFVIAGGVAIIGGGLLLAAGGVKQDLYNAAYAQEYDKGLRKTTLDNWVDAFYNYKDNIYTQFMGFSGNAGHGEDGPSDDTIQWLSDCVSDLWFESTINMNLRNHFVNDVSPTFINSPSKIEDGNKAVISTLKLGNIKYTNSNHQRYPVSSLEKHVARKLLSFDQSRDDNKYYIGVALGEYYNVNKDYKRTNKEKIHYSLPFEYDCCSLCKEDFPLRIHYSEQSFQEDLSDNYKTFLPNNYKDIQGETGEIKNIFKINNDLFVHTTEALYNIPRNQQERVTDQIVSFIGTGSYFEIPPRKILDDDTGSSAGTQHKWSRLKTPNGYFFMCENQRNFYSFNGQKLEPISSKGLYNWFFNNSQIEADNIYYKSNYKKYPYKDNPSNPVGTGFITVYDSQKERIVLTKKDFVLPTINTDYEIIYNNGITTVFPNLQDTINYQNTQGWTYVNLSGTAIKFKKYVVDNVVEIRHLVYFDKDGTQIIKEEEFTASYTRVEYMFIEGETLNLQEQLNTSWTLSFSLKLGSWTSWHSYLPAFYINTPTKFFSWVENKDNNVWIHNTQHNYQVYYDKFYPHIIEYVSLSNPLATRIHNHIRLLTTANKFDENTQYQFDERYITFNKTILYNSRQCTGLLELINKDTDNQNYIKEQIVNNNLNKIVIDRTEKDWLINDFRDIRVDYNKPIWSTNKYLFGNQYYIDKILNLQTLDVNKNWINLESFRDKYLVIRLIFDTFTDVKLITNYSIENEQQSIY